MNIHKTSDFKGISLINHNCNALVDTHAHHCLYGERKKHTPPQIPGPLLNQHAGCIKKKKRIFDLFLNASSCMYQLSNARTRIYFPSLSKMHVYAYFKAILECKNKPIFIVISFQMHDCVCMYLNQLSNARTNIVSNTYFRSLSKCMFMSMLKHLTFFRMHLHVCITLVIPAQFLFHPGGVKIGNIRAHLVSTKLYTNSYSLYWG